AIAPVAYPPPNTSAKETVIPTAKVAFDPQPALEAALGHRVGVLDPFTLYAMGAAREALTQAGLVGHPSLEKRTALVLGHGMPGVTILEQAYERVYAKAAVRVHPLTIPRVMVSAPVSA